MNGDKAHDLAPVFAQWLKSQEQELGLITTSSSFGVQFNKSKADG